MSQSKIDGAADLFFMLGQGAGSAVLISRLALNDLTDDGVECRLLDIVHNVVVGDMVILF